MNPFTFLSSKLKKKSAASDLANSTLFGWKPVGGNSAYSHYKSNEYENAYASIKAIAARFQSIVPYSIDANGKPAKSLAVDKLFHPNQQMSSVQFREALAVTTLVFDEINILVWHYEGLTPVPGGEITPKNIAGYTFLEGATRTSVNGVVTFTVSIDGKQAKFTDKEVITITSGIDPYNLTKGMSASRAARRWTRLDDYIADYQSGFFENGAVPAGQFIIEARGQTEFEDIVNNLKKKHQGAGQNNNVTYTPNIIDPETGKGSGATIQWVPFNSANKDLALKDIFEQINKKIDSAFGVPASIRGVGENNNYATAQQDDKNFVINNIQPFALNIWSQFTHELNRITGGLGVAITFDLEIPTVADEDKTIAERRKIESDILLTMVEKGFSIDSIVDSFDLPVSYKLLKTGYKPPVISNDKPDVDDGSEVLNSPNPQETAAKVTKVASQVEKSYQNRMEDAAATLMQSQIDRALTETKDVGDPIKKEIDQFTDDMMKAVVGMMIAEGNIEYAAGVQLLVDAGIAADIVTKFKLSQTTIDTYRAYLSNVAQSYSDETATKIRSILDRANTQGWTRYELQNNLRAIMDTDEYRVVRLAATEVNRAQALSSVQSMQQIQDEAGVKFEKSMLHTGADSPCEYCAARLDVWFPVDSVMVPKGEALEGTEGGVLINTWDDNDGHDIHANGHCVPTYRVVS